MVKRKKDQIEFVKKNNDRLIHMKSTAHKGFYPNGYHYLQTQEDLGALNGVNGVLPSQAADASVI